MSFALSFPLWLDGVGQEPRVGRVYDFDIVYTYDIYNE